jgi:hypothetical protein
VIEKQGAMLMIEVHNENSGTDDVMGTGNFDLTNLFKTGAGATVDKRIEIPLITPKKKSGGKLVVHVSFDPVDTLHPPSDGTADPRKTTGDGDDEGVRGERDAVSRLFIQSGQLTVTALRGEKLRNAQKGKFTLSKQDPYVKMKPTWSSGDKWKETGVCENGGIKPVWKAANKKHDPTQGFGFDRSRYDQLVSDGQFKAELEVRVLNTHSDREDPIGNGVVDLDDLLKDVDPSKNNGALFPAVEVQVPLMHGKDPAGTLFLTVEFEPHVYGIGGAPPGKGKTIAAAKSAAKGGDEAREAADDAVGGDDEAIAVPMGIPPGRMSIIVKKGVGLKNVETLLHKMDPYVKVSPGWSADSKETEPAYDQHKNPEWGVKEHRSVLSFEFSGIPEFAEKAALKTFELTVEALDKEKMGNDKPIGTGVVSLASLMVRPAPPVSSGDGGDASGGSDDEDAAALMAWMEKGRADFEVALTNAKGKVRTKEKKIEEERVQGRISAI